MFLNVVQHSVFDGPTEKVELPNRRDNRPVLPEVKADSAVATKGVKSLLTVTPQFLLVFLPHNTNTVGLGKIHGMLLAIIRNKPIDNSQ